MRYWILVCFALLGWQSQAQAIVGTWQLTDEKTCFQSEMKEGGKEKESETEKELLPAMGSTGNSVARIIRFDKKGNGEDGIFSTGVKRGADMSVFKYKINGLELLMLDGKSGMMTQELVIDTLTQSTLKVHNAKKDCEIKTFSRIK